MKKWTCGLEITHCTDLCASLNHAQENGYAFISTYLFHPRYKRNLVDYDPSTSKLPATRTDFILQERGGGTNTHIAGRISPWIDVDSEDEFERRNSERALLQELNWAAHLALSAVIIRIQRPHNPNLARMLLSFLKGARFPYTVWLQVPMVVPSVEDRAVDLVVGENHIGENSKEEFEADADAVQQDAVEDKASSDAAMEDDAEEVEESAVPAPAPPRLQNHRSARQATKKPISGDTWHWWSELTTLCSIYVDSLGLVLELSEDLPSEPEIRRWMSEPLKALTIPTRIFCTNRHQYPVLPRSHQALVQRAMRTCSIQVIIGGACRHNKGIKTYQQYIEHLSRTQPPASLYDEQSRGFEDYLQEPLQPLADNLVSSTYEVFELDPYKYSAYEQAVFQALRDRVPDGDGDTRSTVVMVLGAGRGPLVDATLQAAKRADRPVRVYAVEKNCNAVITLRNRVLEEWQPNGADVQVVAGDMRAWDAPEKADIFVSELLGSFADNELSPDCLDGAQRRFLRSDGISIPSSYTSYLAPMQSTKIYKDICRNWRNDPEQPSYTCLETPYVVRLVNCDVLAPVQPVFTFHHPRDLTASDNSRDVTLNFEVKQDAVVHGFAGYFDSVLYADVKMSTHPERHSPDMFSWFPLVFPLLTPMPVKVGERITIHMWRCVTETKVWYEWCLTEPRPTPVHNPHGRSYTIGLL